MQESIERLLVSTEFVLVWCGVTLAYAIFWLLRLSYQRRKVMRDLASANKAREDLRIESATSFCKAYRRLEHRIKELPVLKHAWMEFAECLLIPKPDQEGAERAEQEAIKNTRSPRGYFSLQAIVEPYIHIRFYNTVPNHLTGFGILGTFVGLAAGVGLARTGLTGGADIEEMRLALGQLLSGASLAFLTSIVGLASAITFVIAERVMISRVVAQLDQWTDFLERNLQLVTVEGVAYEQLNELRNQGRLLASFTNDLAIALASALDQKLADSIVPVLRNLVAAVEELRERGSQASDQVLKSVLDQLGDVVGGATRNEVDALGQTLRAAADSLGITVDALQKSQGSLTTAVEEATKGMQSALGHEVETVRRQLETFSNGLDAQLQLTVHRVAGGLEEAGRAGTAAFSVAVGRLEEAVRGLVDFHVSSAAARAQLDAATAALQESTRAVGAATDHFSEVTRPLSTALASFEMAGTRIRDAADQIGQVATSFESTTRVLRDSTGSVSSAWAEYRERFDGVDQTLATLVTQLEQFVENFAEKAARFVAEMDQQLSKSVQSLAGAVTELDGTIEDLRTDRLQ